MELTFVHQYSGDAPKRRRLAKACESCRARKVCTVIVRLDHNRAVQLIRPIQKRCVHFEGAEQSDEVPEQALTDGDDASVRSADHGPTRSVATQPAVELPRKAAHVDSVQKPVSPSTSIRRRFVSDLNPESTFISRSIAARGRPDQKLPTDNIGVWVDRREWDALVSQKNGADGVPRTNAESNPRDDQRPHSTVLGPLIDIYFKKINVFLPILDETEFRQGHAGGLVPEPLAHALCLVAAKDFEAGPHLRLVQSSSTIPPREFSSRMHASVMGALKATCRYDKITVIRILLLASMHVEGAEGAEEASLCLSQAIHHALTLSIHLGQQSNTLAPQDLSIKRLFWCIWTLDRINSAVNGRPIMLSDIDIAAEPFESGESGFPAFDAMLRVTRLLGEVINFYRPHNRADVTGWESDFPGLEEILDEVNGWRLPQSVLATLHLYYLAVAILSHRSRGIKQIPRGTHSSIRQRLCAGEVVRFMQTENARTIHVLPCVPYAVSLALSVSYQHLRQSQLQHQQEDARRDFRACTKVLHSLKWTWCSVDTMATLAQKVLDELDRAPDLAVFRIPRSASVRNENAVIKDNRIIDVIPPPTACAGITEAMQGSQGPSGVSPDANQSQAAGQPPVQDGLELFNGMDDVFDTYLDPNYPVHLDDFPFLDDLPSLEFSSLHQAIC